MKRTIFDAMLIAILVTAGAGVARANYRVQCPKKSATTRCFSVMAGDGFIKGGDGADLYIFGFSEASGVPLLAQPEAQPLADWGFKPGAAIADPGMYMMTGDLQANFPAPTFVMRENEDVREFYLGAADAGGANFRNVKTYKRRKRWLS